MRVGQSLLDDAVAADGIVPHRLGCIPPAGDIVKEDVMCFTLPSDDVTYINPIEPRTSRGLVISFWMPSSPGRAPKARPINWVM